MSSREMSPSVSLSRAECATSMSPREMSPSVATRILGVDPGLASIGYGCIEMLGNSPRHITHGVIRTEANADLAERLVVLSRAFRELLDELKPDEAAVEELFFGRNVTTGIAVSHARGVLLLALAEMNVPISEYKPVQIKRALMSTSGRADKGMVQRMVRMLLCLPDIPRPDDAADGLAIALCHAQHLPSRRTHLAEKKTEKKS
jgi:crossover junction endodeoxyribonuclease RuvC